MSAAAAADSTVVNIERWMRDPAETAMRLLAHGVPLSLLLDLVSPSGPDSAFIAQSERASLA
jgi:hypothetical protein